VRLFYYFMAEETETGVTEEMAQMGNGSSSATARAGSGSGGSGFGGPLRFGNANDRDDDDDEEEEEDDRNDGDYADTFENGAEQQTPKGRGRPKKTTTTPIKRAKASPPKGKQYATVTSRKVSYLMSNITSFKIHNRSDEEISNATVIELKKLSDADLVGLQSELVRIGDAAMKDNTTTYVNNLIARNEPHISTFVGETAHLDTSALRAKLSDIQKKLAKLNEQTRQLEECEQLTGHYIELLGSSKFATGVLKKSIIKVKFERIDAEH
jgi:hypothetical protein